MSESMLARIANVLVAAEQWVDSLGPEGVPVYPIWADDYDKALIDAVHAMRGQDGAA